MTIYVTIKDGRQRSFYSFEEALNHVGDSNNFFVVSVRKGKVLVCANSFSAFDKDTEEGRDNQFALIRIKNHFCEEN